MTTSPPAAGLAITTTCARRGTSAKQAKVHLDRNSLMRVEALARLAERHSGIRPSTSLVIRAALRTAAELYSGDPAGEAAPGQDLISRIRGAIQGR